MEIQHFSHKHPLLYNERLQNDRTRRDCNGCSEMDDIVGPNYSCKECKWFVLHKSCAELPRELQHPSHLKHPLILHARGCQWIKCDGCEDEFWNFSYFCSQCNFNLDPKCVFLPRTKESQCHDHPLALVQKLLPFSCDSCGKEEKGMMSYFCATCSFVTHIKCSSLSLITMPLTKIAEIHSHPLTLVRSYLSFTCDACGKEDKGPFYLCATCSFVAHKKCTTFPSIVKVVSHKQHPLNLTYSLQVNQSHRKVCQVCARMVDTNYGVYYCSSCNFLAHLHCATTAEEKDETFVQDLKDTEHVWSTNMPAHEDFVRDESSDLPAYIAKKMKLGEDGIEIAEEIKHFSHAHELKLTDGLYINGQCDGCVLPIFSPFYKCTVCRFFLHKSCAELLRKKQHSLHRHPFILRSGVFWCNVCRRGSKGFQYYCDKCGFNLDVRCSSVPNILKHDGHEHQLICCHSSDRVKCSCCDSSSQYIFRCGVCEFVLDFKCATLPHSAIYGPHEHPFKLCYTAEDDSSEYHCDICEEERDPKHWFYYCADCSYHAHLKCILKYEYGYLW